MCMKGDNFCCLSRFWAQQCLAFLNRVMTLFRASPPLSSQEFDIRLQVPAPAFELVTPMFWVKHSNPSAIHDPHEKGQMTTFFLFPEAYWSHMFTTGKLLTSSFVLQLQPLIELCLLLFWHTKKFLFYLQEAKIGKRVKTLYLYSFRRQTWIWCIAQGLDCLTPHMWVMSSNPGACTWSRRPKLDEEQGLNLYESLKTVLKAQTLLRLKTCTNSKKKEFTLLCKSVTK